MTKMNRVSGNLMHISMEWRGTQVHIINVYMPSDGSPAGDFTALCKYVLQLDSTEIILMGDFNAHVGFKDRIASDSLYVDNNLLHDVCNDNGLDLKNLLHLTKFKLKNSFEKSNTLLNTWKNGNKTSQIDHSRPSRPSIRGTCPRGGPLSGRTISCWYAGSGYPRKPL